MSDPRLLAGLLLNFGSANRMAGPYHLELVLSPDQLGRIIVYVTDHGDRPISTDGLSARAVAFDGVSEATVDLRSAGANQFEGEGDFHSVPEKVAVLVTDAEGTVWQAVFSEGLPEADHSH